MSKVKDIAIFGAGGFGKEVKTIIDHINEIHPTWNFLGYYDDNESVSTGLATFLGTSKDLRNLKKGLNLVVAIGNSRTRAQIVKKITSPTITFPSIIHPSVVIGDKQSVDVGDGVILTAGVKITCNIKIGNHSIINLNATVGHDSCLSAFSSLMPGVNVAGNVNIREGAFIGSGANVLSNCIIGKYSRIGAGAVVIRDVKPKSTVVGVPAKLIENTIL